MTELFGHLEAVIASSRPVDCPALLGELERLKGLAQLKMLAFSRPEPQTATGRDNLKAEDVALILNVKKSMVYELARSKRLKFYKIGKYKMFKESDVREFLVKAGA